MFLFRKGKNNKLLTWGCCHKLELVFKPLCVSHSRSSRSPSVKDLYRASCQSGLQMMQTRHNSCHALMAVTISVPVWVRHVCWSGACQADKRKLFLGKWPQAAGIAIMIFLLILKTAEAHETRGCATRILTVLQPWVASPGESECLTCATCFNTSWSTLLTVAL